ncbi:MAG: ASKHA domain-containing protein, partial [Desulfobacteraceae bacterium]
MKSRPQSDKTVLGWTANIALSSPSLQDNRADTDRLSHALQREFGIEGIDIDLSMRKELPRLLRKSDYRLRCLVFQDQGRGVLIHAACDGDPAIMAGLAIDLGTTRVVLRLVNLDSRVTLAEKSFENPQTRFGPDVLARIHHADRSGGLTQLQQLIAEAVNLRLSQMCRACGLTPQQIHLFTVAGNTAMSHLFAGLPAHWMIREPYIPAANHFGLIPAALLGLTAAPHARVFIFPNVGSYLGGDLIAGILSTGMHMQCETAILVDVGTNAEVVLGNKDWLMACAGAAGPALEGGMSRMGTTAAPGVIDRVRIDPQTLDFEVQTIGDLPPVGICGSGVIDLAAQLFLAQMVDIRGKFRPETCGWRLTHRRGLAHLTIVAGDASGTGKDLCITQADMDSLVRSKAAMYTILETITNVMGVMLKDLQVIYVAGTFGSLINPRSAI